MKNLIYIILLFPFINILGTNYYIKNGGNDGLDGLSDANAWETINKINTTGEKMMYEGIILIE